MPKEKAQKHDRGTKTLTNQRDTIARRNERCPI
jgi:hypothetical protein